MRPKIKLRPITTDNVTIKEVIDAAKTAQQRAQVVALLQRHGVKRVSDLFPYQVTPFVRELKLVLNHKTPDPHDSVLDPSMMEIR